MPSVVDDLLGRWRLGAERQLADLRQVPRPSAGDLIGGVSVALVLIPQSLAYAGLAGVPAYVGLFASAFPLLIFALLASSPYLQTGPVALTSLLTAGALATTSAQIETTEYVALAGLLAVIVGITRFAIGMLSLGSVVYLMAEPVMIGFTSGAGLVIMSSQLPKAFGVDPGVIPERSNPIAEAVWAIGHPGQWEADAIVISILTLILMLKGRSLHRLFPGVLVAVLAALVYSRVSNYTGSVVPEIDAGLPPWSLDLPWGQTGQLLVGGIVIALVGFAEPASIARTFANEDQSRWSSSREFAASGLANVAAGVTGAFPVGGSFSRSSVNRFAGAHTRWSGFITGLVVLAFLPFAGVLRGLPQAVLGAIVVGAVYALVKPRRLAGLWQRSPGQAGLAWATFIATLLTPPNVERAVVLGVLLTVAFHFVRRFHLEVEVSGADELRLRPRGLLWVATNSKLEEELDRAIDKDGGRGPVIVNLDRSTAIDAAIADSIASGNAAASSKGREFRVVNAPDGGKAILENFDLVVLDNEVKEPRG